MKLWKSSSKLFTLIGVSVMLAVSPFCEIVRASTPGYPQDVPTYQYVTKTVLIGKQQETIHGVVVANDEGYYVDGADLQQLLAYYLVQSDDIDPGSSVELTPNLFDFYPLAGKPHLPAHPFAESSPLPPYAYKCSLYVNHQLVGYAATLEIDDGKVSPDTDTIYVRVSDIFPLLQLLGIGSQWTNSTWNLQAPTTPVSPGADPSTLLYLIDSSGIVGLSSAFLTPSSMMDGPTWLGNLVISPDGKTAYASSYFGGDLYSFNLATRTFGRPIDLPFQPSAIAITPDGKTLILTYWTTSGQGGIRLFNLRTGLLGPQIVLGKVSLIVGLTVEPDGKTAYIAGGDGLFPMNLATGAIGKMIQAPVQFQQHMAIAPDGKTVYLLEGNVRTGSLLPVNLTTGIAGRNIPLGAGPADLALSPDGKMAYVLGYDDSVTPVNLVMRKAGKPIKLGTAKDGTLSKKAIRVSPDGKTAYVFTGPNVISLNLTTMTVESTEPAFLSDPSSPNGFAVAPDQPPTAAFTAMVQGSTVSFDASASKSSCAIVSYAWNFGDGTTAVTHTPTTNHTYKAKGSYRVTLIETDAAGATVNNRMIYAGQMALVNAGSPSAETSHMVQIE